MSENKFGLVYAGALEENVPGGVELRPISFNNFDGVKIAANLYLPSNFDASQSLPAIVVAHPNGGVKEQVSGLFAQRLAEKGFVTLAFDAAYQGASAGEPRQTDRPSNRVEDIRASIDYLETFKGVDTNRIGALGICGGGGYTIQVSKTDKRIKAVGTISMFNSGRVRRNGFGDSQLATIPDRMAQAAAAREKYAKTGEVDYIGDLLTHRTEFTKEQLEQIPAGLYRDGVEYYGDTHFHPNSQSRYTAMSLMDLMAFDAENNVDLIDQPLLMMVGDVSDTRYMTEAVFNKATGTDDKKLILIKGASHIETYWVPEYVDQEVTAMNDFFSAKL
ncbi:alpha/beta hydrolase [Levilactobacillus humaensis]|uniref:alpha/beta hydrolase n=1 Tax=Levilactobacillus humaensis TaxID=2950375 RepID=UPI0021C3C6A0|nr:alpha/beta hydrolase [Levilactobacillus humaensis]